MQAAIDSLDRKIDRRRSGRSKVMCLNVEVSGELTRPKPEMGMWTFQLTMHKLFSVHYADSDWKYWSFKMLCNYNQFKDNN